MEKVRMKDSLVATLRDKDGNIKMTTIKEDLITTAGWNLLCDLIAKTPASVTGESIATGDGSTKIFSLGNKAAFNIVGKVNTVAKGLSSVDNEEGTMTFETAPGNGTAVSADYKHFTEGWKAFYIAIGTGDTTPVVGDTTLEAEITTGGGQRKIGAYTHTTGTKVWDLEAVFNFTAAFSIDESGILNASSAGSLLCRQIFDVTFEAGSGDTLEIVWRFTLS